MTMTTLEPLQQIGGSRIRWRGRELIYFSGCDYFRLAELPAVLKAAAEGLKKFGLNVAASRVTTGHHKIYEVLEGELANFFGAEDALLVPNGYMTGIIVAQALAGEFSHALLDERAHPALLDAAEQLGCPTLKFKHRDAEDFARAVARCGKGARLMALTDGMFSADGSVAPLKAYLKCMPRDGLMVVDDAHGAGVLGRRGQGTVEFEGVGRSRIIQCVTLSKALGVFGGAILGTRELREKVFERSRAFIGSTPLPLSLANAAVRSVKILREKGTDLRRKLNENADYVRTALREAGVKFYETPGPIIALFPKEPAQTEALKRHLPAAGIFPPFFRYPGFGYGWFRFMISSGHSRAQLDKLIKVLKNF
ncbi:MAG TPA: pyridoxal phosphate-dependent aminotransferase family protein [Candidatus Acidoferrum sp.]|nr:pyridoxal phosphate-dependent aminotransferase family protein [Candidatus Acidoferrum sp.]